MPRLSVVSSFGQFCGLDRFPNDIIHSSLVDSSSVSVSGSGKKRNVLQLNTASKKKKNNGGANRKICLLKLLELPFFNKENGKQFHFL